jgi:hypothetical protein
MEMNDETQGNEPEVSVDGLQKSLDELLEAADATELSKAYGGVSVEHSGRYDEDGKGGGGLAGAGDVGGLDDLMIAKMSDAGLPAGLIADFAAFMAKEDDDEDDDEDVEINVGKMGGGDYYRSDDAADEEEPAEPIQKALDTFREDPDIADAVDVSPFLEALTTRTADQLDVISKSHHVFQASQNEVNRHLAVALNEMGQLVKSQEAVIYELGARLGMIERQPVAPRGATTLQGAQALAKSLPGELGGNEGSLVKSELVSTLTYMNLEKGIKHVNGRSTNELACMYDGGAAADPSVVEAVRTFLRTHPHEADAARNYQ